MITAIRTEIIGDPTLSPLVGSRVYYRNPISQQTQPYITFIRTSLDRNDVQETEFFEFSCFSTDMTELENMSRAIIALFEDKTVIDTKTIALSEFIATTDSASKIATSGFFFNITTFRFIYSS